MSDHLVEMDKSQIGLAGEFYVLAQLHHNGFVATLTLGNTKGVDVLVTNPELNTLYKVEVKTTRNKPGRDRLFGDNYFYRWPMGKKHEDLIDPKLVYCFVHLSDPNEKPKYFVVPSKEVAEYVKWQHQHWLKSRTNPVKETTMRNFRIEVDDPNGYENNWSLFSE